MNSNYKQDEQSIPNSHQDSQSTYPVMPELYQKAQALLEEYLERHSKVLPIRFDVRYPQDFQEDKGDMNKTDFANDKEQVSTIDNNDISKFMAKLIQHYKRKKLDPAYMWTREQERSETPHCHGMLLMNGHKIQNPYGVFSKAEELWQKTIGSNQPGLIHHCNKNPDGSYRKNGEVFRRSEGIPEHVQRQISYMVKPSGKGEPKDGLRDFGMSRLKGKKKG
ncbi:MAG TPA: inovirus Gp2 family protein [Candidatus Desulfovibrio intestinipullorum]|uniref:Inovirus Gp2 family protein n=1 Tax=Candidatus Desulfovibrio intestinipullorum TaxID=2838536 RepID=A0A9D1PXL1_9BACT|nr:inovirus Gp2 family protein [Candidatus Desulfovibrio intestinipullorum]